MAVINEGGDDNYEYLDGIRCVYKVLKSKPSLPPLVVKKKQITWTHLTGNTNWEIGWLNQKERNGVVG